MRGIRNRKSVAFKRELFAVLSTILPPTGIVVSNAGGNVTVNFTPNEQGDSTTLAYRIDDGTPTEVEGVTSPDTTSVPALQIGETVYVTLRTVKGTDDGPWSALYWTAYSGGAASVSASNTKAEILAWLATQGVDVEAPAVGRLNKAELLELVAAIVN